MKKSRLHVLIVPSEEYTPDYDPLAGIFQKHQLDALAAYRSDRYGLISVRLVHSVPMILKAVLFRVAGARVANELGQRSVGDLLRLLMQRLLYPGKAVRHEGQQAARISRIDGIRLLPPSANTDHHSWVRAGMVAFDSYVERYGKPDLIHAHNALNAGLFALKLKQRFGVPYVLTEHSSYYQQGRVPHRLHEPVRAAIAGASRYMVVSRALESSLQQSLGQLPRTVEVLPNVLPLEFAQQEGARPRGEYAFTFLAAGNLVPIKGHSDLLRAFAHLSREPIDARLFLVGDGPLRCELETLSRHLKIYDRVHFLGRLPQEQLRALMTEADAFVLPSRFETFGVVVIEAMACGLPVIATACGGPGEIVRSDTGVLTKPADPDTLAVAMRKVMLDRTRFDSDNIRKRAVSDFGPENFAARMGAIYDSVAEAAGQP